ncbi:DNA repair protein XRCC1 [Toxorhynchites rutilus septentrionalis]|uniref:DNA repair protein XRCC1 n=1 Tax=Toxorhynchites rutilus septentrionalis TaxID=329112 RepID=UPI00247A150A|nr:DNA repair protein XRCC1 [Toxorhynchites rutilus septentrionalis]
MPNARIQSVECFSSEDKDFPASNLLAKEARKWKCREQGEKSAFVVLRLDKELSINGIDIGNEHSAFIEVLVARSGPSNPDFKEILLTSSFMTPIESRNSTNVNGVRCFTQSSLVASVACEKWNLVKIICTQPFNSRVQYGISFIRLHSPNAEKSVKPLVPENIQQQIKAVADQHVPKVLKLGRFTVREESPDSDSGSTSATTLFARWKQSRISEGTQNATNEKNPPVTSMSTAAAIRNASTPVAIRKAHSTPLVKKTVTTTPSARPRLFDDDDEEVAKPINRNRDSILYDKDDDKPNERLDKKLTEDRNRQKKEYEDKMNKEKQNRSLKETKPNLHNTSASKFKNFLFDDPVPKDQVISKVEHKVPSASNNVKGSPQSVPVKPQPDKRLPEDNRKKNVQEHKPVEFERKKRGSDCGVANSVSPISKKPKLQLADDKEDTTKRRKMPLYKPFNKLLENVVLVISGIQNPDRANLRNQALGMGAKYKSDWDSNCTHLICAFKNTPKYNQVHGKGKIIRKSWIERCHAQRKRLSWRKFALDSDDAERTDSEEEVIDITNKPKEHSERESHTPKSSIKDSHQRIEKAREDPKPKETDEEVLAHYDLDDVIVVEKKTENYDVSGSDTEEDIEKVNRRINKQPENASEIYDKSTDEDGQNNIIDAVTSLNFFSGKIFFLDEELGVVDVIKLEQYVKLYRGTITTNISEAHFVVTRNKKYVDKQIASELIKPLWIYECHDMECLIPYQRYLL